MKNTIIILVLVFALNNGYAQESTKKSRRELKAEKISQQKEAVKKLVEGKSFVFDARTATSPTAGTVNITYPYSVKLNKDSIYSYLPYYGRAYSAEYGSTESPMVFNLPVQELEITKNKKKGYQVNVKVKRGMDYINFNFDVSETGNTTLTVNSSNRQVITYYGELAAKKEKDNS